MPKSVNCGATSRLFSFWSGAPLGYLERLCIASMLEAKHSVELYTFDPDLAVPDGVTLRDAAEVVPRSRVVAHETGSLALFSDIFRYEALLRGAGTWVDLDVLLLKPIDNIGDHIFGWQDPNVINGAILQLPPESPCLKQLVDLCRSDVVVPPQWSAHRKLKQKLRALIGVQVPMQRLEWGSIGPFALTRLIERFKLLHRCQPVDALYPVPWQQAHRVFEPDAAPVWNSFSSNTRAVHLWNDRIKLLKARPPPLGSFIAEMCKRYRIEPL